MLNGNKRPVPSQESSGYPDVGYGVILGHLDVKCWALGWTGASWDVFVTLAKRVPPGRWIIRR